MLESLACGTPVVATPTAGASEVRDHFPDDVELTEPEALSQAIGSRLRSDRRTAAATRMQIQRAFSVEVCAARYREVYMAAARSRQDVP